MKKIKLAILGGDRRQLALAEWMLGRELDTVCFALPGEMLPKGARLAKSLDNALEDADAVILPLPVSGDGITLKCPLSDEKNPVELKEILNRCQNRLVLGGNCSPSVKSEASRRGVTLIDYFDFEELKVRNSVLTSEGAISVAMNELDIALCDSRSAVIGYGRIAKTLAPMLKSLGSRVTVAARKSTDLAWAAAYGFNTLKIGVTRDGLSTLTALSDGYDVIFNTVPYWLFDEALLSVLSKNTLIIDLASAPGGVEPNAARRLGTRVITALSIPGKYAPVSAGRLIGEYVYSVLEKELKL